MANSESGSPKARGFAGFSPLGKLAVWLTAVAALAGAIQSAAWVLGLDFNILLESGGGRGVLLGLALGALLVMMAIDGRPAADYGLAVGSRWQKVFLGGFAIGTLAYFGYCALILVPLACTWRTDSISFSRCFGAGLSATTAIPIALTQQIIFSGYLLSILRDRYGRTMAVLVPAALFAVLRRMDDPAALLSSSSYPLVVGMFLIATLLGILRLYTGSILYPAGFLSGCIFVRRFLRKTSLLATTGSHEAVGWTAPNNDPMQAPLMWLFLLVGIGVCWLLLSRQKKDKVLTIEKAVDTGFKRVFPFSNAGMLAPLDLWLGRLIDARFQVGLKYIPRLVVILVFSAFNTILSLPERIVAPLLLRWRRVPDPVFIVGMHRSGTTHLHNLLALDPQFCTPRTYQILNPAGFFFFSWLITPLLGAFLPWKRPMDSVRFNIFSPQEDEFAIAGVSRLSPHWAMTFPRRGAAYDRYIFPDRLGARELSAWKGHLLIFLRKLTFWSRKRPLLKNPYNTGRVAVLDEMFPRARFIHICRHPFDVYRSNVHLAREGHIVNQLQDPDEDDSYQTRFLDNYREMEEAFNRQAARLPSDRVADMRFEDLERDPMGQIRKIYALLKLDFSDQFQERIERYLEGIANYQKNRFKVVPQQQRREIEAKMGPLMERWGYSGDVTPQPIPARKAA